MRYAHWLLRIGFAAVFLYHGLGKFPNLSGFAQMAGIPLFLALIVALFETGGGLLVLIGGISRNLDWATRLGGALVIPVMLGAIAKVHWPQWSFVPSETHPMGGMEFQVVLTLLGLYFLIRGNADMA